MRDRLNRPEGEDLHPREQERLTEMMDRSDALSTACCTIERQSWENAELQRKTIDILREMHREASEAFRRYKWEVGLPEPGGSEE